MIHFSLIFSLFSYPTFLLLWPGARPTAMAGVSSISSDANAPYYNPAGLSFISYEEIYFTHCHLLPENRQGSFLEFESFHTPINRWWHLGFYSLFFIRGRTKIFEEEDFGFDTQIGLCSGFKPFKSLGLGLSLNYLYLLDIIGSQESKGWGITSDLGLLYKPFTFLSLALVLKNLGKDISYIETSKIEKLPRMLRMGIGWSSIERENFKLLFSSELTKLFDERELWKGFGCEVSGFQVFSLRMGYFIDKVRDREGFTYGIGFHLKKVNIDIGTDERVYTYPRSDWKFSITYRP